MSVNPLANPYTLIKHENVIDAEDRVISKRKIWTTHRPIAVPKKATCCWALDCTACYTLCWLNLCKCKCGQKKFHGQIQASHKIVSLEDESSEGNCCHRTVTKSKVVAEIIGPPSIDLTQEDNKYCLGCCVIQVKDFDLTIDTTLGKMRTGLVSELDEALRAIWPSWAVTGELDWLKNDRTFS